MVEINWLGHACFRLRDKNALIITDPFGKELGYPPPRVKADIVTLSNTHPHHSTLDGIKGQPKVLQGPGEYEIQGIFVTGIAFTSEPEAKGKDKKKESPLRNTIYVFEFDNLTVCHLGGLAVVPTQADVEGLSAIDVLLVPVGGNTTLDGAAASEVISLLEPRLVIPMHYRTGVQGEPPLDSVERFLRALGAKRLQPQEEIKVSRSSLPEETQVVLLVPKGQAD